MKQIILSISMLLLNTTTCNAQFLSFGAQFAKITVQSYVGYSNQKTQIDRIVNNSARQQIQSASYRHVNPTTGTKLSPIIIPSVKGPSVQTKNLIKQVQKNNKILSKSLSISTITSSDSTSTESK